MSSRMNKFPYFGYLKDEYFPFFKEQFILIHSDLSDQLTVSSIIDLDIRYTISNTIICLLVEISNDRLVNERLIDQLIEVDNSYLFNLAFKHDLIENSALNAILHMTASKGEGNSLSYLLDKLPNKYLSSKDVLGNTLVHSAALNIKSTIPLDILLKFFQKSDSYDGIDFWTGSNVSGMTPLHLAITVGSPIATRILLAASAGSIIDCKYGGSNTALHLAAKLNKTECIRAMSQFLSEIIDGEEKWKYLTHFQNDEKMLPVMLSDDCECIKELLNHEDVERVVCGEYGPILHWACGNDNLKLTQILLNLNPPAKIDKKNPKNFTPLKIAAKKGFARITEILLQYGGDPNFIGKEFGYPPLTNAAQYGYFEVVKLLVEKGAKLYSDKMTVTPLHAAVYEGKSEIVKYFLKECGIDPDLLDRNHMPPLFRAVTENRSECVNILLEFGANIQISIDKKHSTPLHLAINCGERQIVKILLENGARPEESNSDGITPLMLTTKHDHASLIPLLMSYGIALTKVDNALNTVFHHAVMNGAVKCMEYLLKRLGKVKNICPEEQLFKIRNNANKNAFDIGIEEKQESVLVLLISYSPENYFRDHSTILHKIYDKRMYCTLKAIMERMVVVKKDRVKMSPKFLDSNELGQYPSDPKFKHMIPSFLHKLLTCPDTELKYHPIVTITINRKLAVYRWWYIFSLIFYLFFLFALMFALIRASYLCDEKLWDYSTSLDRFRVICEIFCVLCWVVFLLDEMIEFLIEWIQIKHKKANEEQIEQIDFTLAENSTKYLALLNLIRKFCNGHKMFEKFDRILYCLLSALINYFISFNLIDSGALLCFFILIILRAVGSYLQWSFASITFVLFSLRLFKYTRIIPSLGAYVHSVFRVFVKDIPRFIVIIIIITIAYVGGIHLAARQQPYSLNISSLSLSDQQCTRTKAQLLWFNSERTLGYDLRTPLVSSILFLLDGGPGNFEQDLLNVNFLFTFLYLLFAFTVIVVLLNILIAQLSETYSEIIKTNEFHYLIELVVNLELKSNLAFITGKIFRKYNMYDTIELSTNMWRELRHLGSGNDIEIQIDEINGKVDNSGELIKIEAQKTVINHEWIQENISGIRDTISHISSVINDEAIISRISKIEVQMNNQSQILQSILETIKGSS